MTSRSGVGRGRVWRSVAGVAVVASLSIGGAQVVRADEPVVDTAAPPVVESSAHDLASDEEPIVAVGLPPVPPATVVVAVGPPQVPSQATPDVDHDADVDVSDVGGAVAGALAAAALGGWRGA